MGLVVILDYIASIMQSIIFVIIVAACTKNDKNNYFRNMVATLLIFISISPLLVGTYGDAINFAAIITHLVALAIIMLVYRYDLKMAVMSFTLTYCVMLVASVMFGNILFEMSRTLVHSDYVKQCVGLIVYIPSILVIIFWIKIRKKVRNLCYHIIEEDFFYPIIAISFITDFLIMFYQSFLSPNSQVLKNILYILFFIACAFMIISVTTMYNKAKKIFELNNALEIKNNELRKIKHDYGAQISYLYALHLMNRFDDLGKSLKSIIDRNGNVKSSAEVNLKSSVVFSMSLKPARECGIHVIVEDRADFTLLEIDEMELYRIVSNIVNNAIKAMDKQGIIIAKTYNTDTYLKIRIENNGPKIEESILSKIFNSGFTTKSDLDKNHGYGLSIVKELIEKYDGKISVRSTDESTAFCIEFPIKQ